MRYFIYRSPKHRGPGKLGTESQPIAEGDLSSRRTLEDRGWQIIKTIGGEELPEESAGETALDADLIGTVYDLDLKPDVAEALENAGYLTHDQIRGASDDALKEVEGLTPAVLRKMRKTLDQRQVQQSATPPAPLKHSEWTDDELRAEAGLRELDILNRQPDADRAALIADLDAFDEGTPAAGKATKPTGKKPAPKG